MLQTSTAIRSGLGWAQVLCFEEDRLSWWQMPNGRGCFYTQPPCFPTWHQSKSVSLIVGRTAGPLVNSSFIFKFLPDLLKKKEAINFFKKKNQNFPAAIFLNSGRPLLHIGSTVIRFHCNWNATEVLVKEEEKIAICWFSDIVKPFWVRD